MSPEWLTAIGTVGTFVVIAASAAAALFQLRHMRGSNQIVALTEVRETIESANFQAAELFVSQLAERFEDPQVREGLLAPYFPPEFQPVRHMGNFFETFGVFVKNGIIDSYLACDLWAGVVARNWEALRPVVASRRARTQNPALWENFEYLAAISTKFMDAHQSGTLPKNAPRMPLPEPWPEAQPRA